MLSYNEAYLQIQKLRTIYPKLSIAYADSTKIHLCGSIEIYRTACSYTVQKEYPVEIIVPIGRDTLPLIIDTGNMIDKSYQHRYTNGILCLETNTAIRSRFIDGMDLVAWMDEFVEPYFFSYEFYSRYGYFPFGERPHGLEGIIHTYQDYFHEPDISKACSLIVFAAESEYRGHRPCPCGSGKKLRSCHGKYLFPIMTDQRKKTILQLDLLYLRKELKAIEQSRANHDKTKR